MTNTLERKALNIAVPNGTQMTKLGLVLPDNLSLDEWKNVGNAITNFVEASAWWFGDWAFYGEWSYGNSYREIIASSGLDYGTIRNYASVAGRFELSRRRDNLSFGHHATVAAMPMDEQDRWLDLAEDNSWSVKTLREMIRASKQSSAPKVAATPANYEIFELTAPIESLELWDSKASSLGLTVFDWAIKVLDAAASA